MIALSKATSDRLLAISDDPMKRAAIMIYFEMVCDSMHITLGAANALELSIDDTIEIHRALLDSMDVMKEMI